MSRPAPSQVAVTCDGLGATAAVATEVGRHLQAGDVVLLSGSLGAGKTAFTAALARALGVTAPVTSPTFTLVQHYPTSAGFDLLHVDVYRLERVSEIVDLGLAELLEEEASAVIEWGERALPVVGPDHLDLRLERGATELQRRLVAAAAGRWRDRWEALVAGFERALPGKVGAP